MPDQPRIGAGSQLRLGDGATPTEAFTKVAKIVEIDPITETSPLVDATTLDDTTRQFIGGLAEGDEFGIRAQFIGDEVTHGETSGMDKVFIDKVPRNFELQFNGQSKKLKFRALCTQRGFGGVSADGIPEHTWRMKLTSAVTLVTTT
jgi:hypothetical protein